MLIAFTARNSVNESKRLPVRLKLHLWSLHTQRLYVKSGEMYSVNYGSKCVTILSVTKSLGCSLNLVIFYKPTYNKITFLYFALGLCEPVTIKSFAKVCSFIKKFKKM